MSINNDNLSNKESLLDPSTKTLRKQNQWTIDDLINNVNSADKSPYSSTGSLVIPQSLNKQDDSLIGNDNDFSEIQYEGSNISSSTRRGSFVLSDPESDRSSTLLTQSNTRRRALSTTSRPKDRFSMLEFGSSRDDAAKLSPTRHSMAFDNGFNINNKLIRNSLEDRETIDRVRIGNAGKGFGNLINDEGEKESIADLIADVKDDEAVKLAKMTQKHAGQKNRIHNTETDIEKTIARKDGYNPSETTLTNSKMCKQFLEIKYHALFKIINNNEIYNPLIIVKNRKNDMTREGSDHSLGSSEKFSGGSSKSRIKSRESLPRRKELNIWNVSHMEIIKDYEQRNKFVPSKQIVRVNGHEVKDNKDFDDKVYPIFGMEAESDETKKRQKHLQLSHMFDPPKTQEIPIMSPNEEKEGKESNELQLEGAKHSIPSSNSIISTSQGKEDFHSKSKKWSIHLFKRKDKKHKSELSSSDVGTIQLPDNYLGSQTNAKDISETSSGDQTPRSSLEDSMQQVNSEDNNERMHYESDDALSRRNSLDIPVSHSNKSSTRNSMDLELQNTTGSLNIEDHYDKFKFLGYEQHEDNRLSSENKTAESSESEEEYESELVGETVLVNLDVLPQELVDLVLAYQEQGIVDHNVDNGHFVELDIGLNEHFKFHKLISYGVDLLNLQVSLVYDNSEDIKSLSQQDADEIIKKCDEYIEHVKEATEFLKANEISLAKRIIEYNNYVSNGSYMFESINVPFAFYPTLIDSPNTLASSFGVNQQSIVAEYKMNIEEGIKLLNNKLVNIEDTVNKLEGQHASFIEEMETTLNKIEKMTLEVNNDYFNNLKILEDEIHLLIAEREKPPWLDVFYLMMSYVITAIMIMYWLIVACFKLLKKVLLVPCKMANIIASLNSSH